MSRLRRLLPFVAVAAVLLGAACAETGGRAVLAATAAKMDDIASGDLRLRMVASAGAQGPERPVGFELSGPFAVAQERGALPVARLRFTRLAGTPLEPTTFLSTGQRAFLEVDGRFYELPEEQVQPLRAREGRAGGNALEGLDVDGWAEGHRVEDAGRVDGVGAQRVTGEVDVVEALNDLVAVAGQVGAETAGLRPVEGKDAEHLRRAVRSSRLEVVTGRDDRMLRRLRIHVTFAAADARRLEAALGPLAGTRLHLELDISKPNREVRVDPPARVEPLSELPERR